MVHVNFIVPAFSMTSIQNITDLFLKMLSVKPGMNFTFNGQSALKRSSI